MEQGQGTVRGLKEDFNMTRMLIVAVALVVAVGAAHGQTDVTENISTNTTWDLAGSPYRVHGAIGVTSSSTLTIDPGVTVKFHEDATLWTYGGCSIVADGAYGNEILFTSNAIIPAQRDWISVMSWQSPASSFSHCVFEYAHYGLYPDHSDPIISHCTFRNCYYGILCEEASPQIASCDMIQNWCGIGIIGPDAAPVINDCNLYDNTSFNMYVSGYVDPPMATIDAQSNWWGTDVGAEIESSIYIFDSPYIEIDYDPWLPDVPVEPLSWGRVKALFVR